jgi:hypothetical protein
MAADINTIVREIVRDELSSFTTSDDPEMISTDEAAQLCKCGKQVILELHHDRANNDFPSVQLGPRTIVVDKTRLKTWLAKGGV